MKIDAAMGDIVVKRSRIGGLATLALLWLQAIFRDEKNRTLDCSIYSPCPEPQMKPFQESLSPPINRSVPSRRPGRGRRMWRHWRVHLSMRCRIYQFRTTWGSCSLLRANIWRLFKMQLNLRYGWKCRVTPDFVKCRDNYPYFGFYLIDQTRSCYRTTAQLFLHVRAAPTPSHPMMRPARMIMMR